jgi:outer membrane protein OmpA-like peptidoglycan-associated protein
MELLMYRKTLMIAACALAVAGCSSTHYPAYPDGWTVSHVGGETDYALLDEVLFPTDSADLSPRAYDIVAQVADDAQAHPNRPIEIDGYTDTTGTHDHNQILSQQRADAVADILVRHGIDRKRILTRGLGETNLAVPTGNNVSEHRNRRVVIRLLAPLPH